MKRIFLIAGFAIFIGSTAVFSQQSSAVSGGNDPKTGQLQKEVPQNEPDRLPAGQDTKLLSPSSSALSNSRVSSAKPENSNVNEPDRIDVNLLVNKENVNPSSSSLNDKKEVVADDPTVLKPGTK